MSREMPSAGASQARLASSMDAMRQREAVAWFREPGRFPNGVFAVFANIYELTDGTGDVQRVRTRTRTATSKIADAFMAVVDE